MIVYKWGTKMMHSRTERRFFQSRLHSFMVLFGFGAQDIQNLHLLMYMGIRPQDICIDERIGMDYNHSNIFIPPHPFDLGCAKGTDGDLFSSAYRYDGNQLEIISCGHR